jgi:hypothetical protein
MDGLLAINEKDAGELNHLLEKIRTTESPIVP